MHVVEDFEVLAGQATLLGGLYPGRFFRQQHRQTLKEGE
jgi:hypothetical protein